MRDETDKGAPAPSLLFEEHRDRLEAMGDGDQKWDLSSNDRAAINQALWAVSALSADRDALRAHVEWLEQALRMIADAKPNANHAQTIARSALARSETGEVENG